MFVVPPKKLFIMQGIPGSGKSTVARDLASAHITDSYNGAILSTDDYWTTEHPLGEGNEHIKTTYNYDPAKIGEAHRWNQRRCVDAMRAGTNFIFIDNTNIKQWQALPYLSLGDMYRYTIQVISVSCGLDEAIRRNAIRPYDRRIPEDVIRKMHADLEPLL